MNCIFLEIKKIFNFVFLLTVASFLSACDGDVVTLDNATTAAVPTYVVGGTVTGLVGSGLVLKSNGGDDLSITADGSFVFSTAIADASNYLVSIATQPTAPAQNCSVSLSSGTISGADVNNVVVNCVEDTYTVSGFITGLSGSGLVLQNNAGDNLAVATDGSFIFSTTVSSASAYSVTVLAQPAT
ncbi:MAG: hypothetical protein KAT90_03615, partial [Gammaproteobacteria bacterium]|nr:hypothetical protein [Gammaproteobacteria bacterium]